MRDGWVKLYRSSRSNYFYLHDKTGWQIFVHLLLCVDSNTGKWDSGRFQLSRELDIKPTTIYQALQRLKKARMIDIQSNNKYSTITIVNWHKYQHPDDSRSDNKQTTTKQPTDTKQEVINKNKNNKRSDVENKIIKFLNTQESVKNPEGYLDWIKNKYGVKNLHKLLKIDFHKWIEHLDYWIRNS